MMFFVIFLIITTLGNISLGVSPEEEQNALAYLTKYRYFSSSRSASGSSNVKQSIKSFQHFFKLKETGELNNETVAVMKKPRCTCGNPDVGHWKRRNKRYETDTKWYKTQLRYYFETGEDLDEATQRRIIKEAFNMWARHTDLTFTQTDNGEEADIKISFGKYKHKGTKIEKVCGWDFDGWSGTLAHAFMPLDGRLHFDNSESWSDGHVFVIKNNLLEIAAHEIGHVLGMGHSEEWPSIMWPTYHGHSTVKLFRDDVDGIQSLYDTPDVKYLVGKLGENCDDDCTRNGRQCAAIGHNFPPEGALEILKSNGISCTSGDNEDYDYEYADNPGYMASGGWGGQCIGYLNIPYVINCEDGSNPNFQRLCPCK